MNDWNQPGQAEDFLPFFKDWTFDWLDVPALVRSAQRVFEYPMVDKDPLPQWSFGRVTLMGDAAHPMYPRGSNGSAQGLIDARTLADLLASPQVDVVQALKDYEAQRLPATSQVVQTNRSVPPDAIIMKVDELSQGKPFDNLDDLISQDELRQISENYKRIAGFALKAT
jgi:2-polyprenyl-6-methoxyphenol hydroxylase-like FAD-dependent oxidoreductase